MSRSPLALAAAAVARAGLAVALFSAWVPSPAADPPRVDEEVETLYRQVSWEDFKGRWTEVSRFVRAQAYIATGIQLPEVEVVAAPLPSGGFRATAPDLEPFALMSKYDSSYLPGGNTERVLAHEQGHFDITEVVTRRLAGELRDVEGRGPTAEAALKDFTRRVDTAFQTAQEELDRLQSRYDGETRHGTRKKEQKKWFRRIEEMLAAAPPVSSRGPRGDAG